MQTSINYNVAKQKGPQLLYVLFIFIIFSILNNVILVSNIFANLYDLKFKRKIK